MKIIDCAGSSNITEIRYYDDMEELLVTYQGGATYSYSGVTQLEADNLELAPSKGQYVNAQIKPNHLATKV